MSKIGIVTIAVDNTYNYGNKLQTYALQEFLRQNGDESVAIRYMPAYALKPVAKESPLKKLWKQSPAQTVDDALRILKRRIHADKIRQLTASRIQKFKAFGTDFVHFSERLYDEDSDLKELDAAYDCFVAGSDQVWNPYYEGAYPFYYLQFAAKGKRIAYAPSISAAEIPEHQKKDIGEWIRGVDALSVREQESQRLLLREFGLEAKLVCDPVFLLNKSDWQKIAVYPQLQEKYFAVYILGKKTAEQKRIIRKIERKYKLKAVDLFTADDAESVFAGPREFLGILEKAEFVLTDSFHGAAMSVIFERPLVTLERKSVHKTTSRIDNLLELTGLCKFSPEDALANLENVRQSYRPDKQKLDAFVADSKAYLQNALKGAQK